MLDNFTSDGSRYNDFAEGFGTVWDGYGDNNAHTLAGANDANVMSVEDRVKTRQNRQRPRPETNNNTITLAERQGCFNNRHPQPNSERSPKCGRLRRQPHHQTKVFTLANLAQHRQD